MTFSTVVIAYLTMWLFYYYYFINVLANYIQCTQLLVNKNLALTKSTGQKVHSLNALNSTNMQLQTASNMHTH